MKIHFKFPTFIYLSKSTFNLKMQYIGYVEWNSKKCVICNIYSLEL